MKKATFAYDTDVVMPVDDGTTAVVIHTTVTNSGDAVKSFLREIRRTTGAGGKNEPPLIVGLDTEWRVVVSHDDGYRDNRMAVLQLCVGHRCLVFQTVHADYVPAALRAFLANPDHRFVGVSVDGDVERLYCDCKILVATPVDLRHVAAEVLSRPELRRAGLKALVREVMGVVMEKPKHVTMSRWSRRPLSPEQVRYAAIDAFVSYEVGRLLLTSQRALELEDAAGAAGTISPFVCFELP
ncbi:Werner Syndrome-like exonuclease [Sorghum bicolor]|nr:Werner Syndrome-like exonuclease [Sorghum bicolor]|eukprot:XP_002456090.1 Werner Syndrome-like exonuclease [Sorghum bicolor]